MICPKCNRENLKSKVLIFGTVSTLMGFEYYFDEEGFYHSHDPNKIKTRYSCTNGHNFVIIKKNKCPSCEYGAESEVIEEHNKEAQDATSNHEVAKKEMQKETK